MQWLVNSKRSRGCPTGLKDVRIEVRYGDGATSTGKGGDWNECWNKRKVDENTITHYRILGEEAAK